MPDCATSHRWQSRESCASDASFQLDSYYARRFSSWSEYRLHAPSLIILYVTSPLFPIPAERHVNRPHFFPHKPPRPAAFTIHDSTMSRPKRRGPRVTSRKGVFNPEDATKVKHTKVGVWDLYEEKEPELARIPGSSRLERLLTMKQSLPYLWQMLKDIGSIRSCWWLLVSYMVLVVVSAMVPALALWYVSTVCASLEGPNVLREGTKVRY